MKKWIYLSAFLSLAGFSFSQLCTPTFVNGCFSWNTKSVQVGSINWTFDEMDCSVSDYTNLNTTIVAGNDIPFSASAGNWCGFSVWVDFDKDNQLDDSENLYHEGNGNTEVYAFDFDINIPQTTINGVYTMRVISSWGSDGYTPGANGSGGCGDYQYGNYIDFSITVTGGQFPLAVNETEISLGLAPNPVNESLSIEGQNLAGEQYSIFSAEGSQIAGGRLQEGKQEISTSALKSGIYFLQLENRAGSHKFVKL